MYSLFKKYTSVTQSPFITNESTSWLMHSMAIDFDSCEQFLLISAGSNFLIVFTFCLAIAQDDHIWYSYRPYAKRKMTHFYFLFLLSWLLSERLPIIVSICIILSAFQLTIYSQIGSFPCKYPLSFKEFEKRFSGQDVFTDIDQDLYTCSISRYLIDI